jgi:hypothetical protein
VLLADDAVAIRGGAAQPAARQCLPVIGEAADGRIAVRPDQVVALDFET